MLTFLVVWEIICKQRRKAKVKFFNKKLLLTFQPHLHTYINTLLRGVYTSQVAEGMFLQLFGGDATK